MSGLIKFENVQSKIILIRNQHVILNNNVADLYDVQTKEINQAVRNNPDKFPEGYIFELTNEEWKTLRSKFLTLEQSGKGQHPKYLPTAFTEKGLYMLATIIKSKKATETTIAIVETFSKIRELSRSIAELSENPDELTQKSLMQRSGDIIFDIFGEDLKISDTETSIELNFGVLKLKHSVKKKKD